MRNLRKTATLLATAAVVAAVSLTSAQAATASTDTQVEPLAPPTQEQTITVYDFQAGLNALEGSDLPRTEVVAEDGAVFYEYSIADTTLTLPSEATFTASVESGVTPADPGTLSPMVEFVTKGQYLAIGLNRAEQAALTTGGMLALQIAICAFPPACPLAIIGLGSLNAYATTNGLCPEGQLLWWYDVPGGSTVQCRSTPPTLP